MLYSLKTDIYLESCLFKYIKGEGDTFYLTDLQVYKKNNASKVWGENKQNCPLPEDHSPSPVRQKKRPTSSPEKLQTFGVIKKVEENREEKSISFKLMKENEKIKNMLRDRIKTSAVFKLEPISIKKSRDK